MHTTARPFGAIDDIADYERRKVAAKQAHEEVEAAEKREREAQRLAAIRLVAERGHGPPTSLARTVIIRNGAIVVDFVDALPTGVIARVQLSQQTASSVELCAQIGAALRSTFAEARNASSPDGQFWQTPKHDALGQAPGYVPPELAPVPGPLFVVDAPARTEPTDDERACAVELAREAVDGLAPTKNRARDLAAALRMAIATGPHAIEALALALEQRAGIATTTDETEPPRAA